MAKIPSMLNYTRSIIPSEGIFWALDGDIKRPVPVAPKTVLGTISNYADVDRSGKADATKDSEKIATPGANNIQKIQACSLPHDCERFALEFSLKFMPNSSEPGMCNEVAFVDGLEAIAAAYQAKGGYQVLAERYIANLLNGRFLWRNRYGTDRKLTLTAPNVASLGSATFEINDSTTATLTEDQKAQAKPWVQAVADALAGQTDPLLLMVSAEVTVGMGQELYPSQEFVEAEKSGPGKTLFDLPCGEGRTAAMHSQKIGNAIRTIDSWYPEATEDRPLAVEPYTVDKRRGQTLRLPSIKKSDFYSYLEKHDTLLEQIKTAKSSPEISGDVHYFMAVLIRGGVFSGDKKSK